MHKILINRFRGTRSQELGLQAISLGVLSPQVESQEDDDDNKDDIAAHVDREGSEVAGGIGGKEDLWA